VHPGQSGEYLRGSRSVPVLQQERGMSIEAGGEYRWVCSGLDINFWNHIQQVKISFGQPVLTLHLPDGLVVQKVNVEPWAYRSVCALSMNCP
jgi:hypothetical protein